MYRTPKARRTLSIVVALCCATASCGSDSSGGDDTIPVGSESDAGRSELPNACCAIQIVEATASDGEVALTFDANFTPDFERNHMHVFRDPQEAGAGSSDFQERGFAEQGKRHPTEEYPQYTTQADASVASEFRIWSVDGFGLVRLWSASRQLDPIWDLSFSSDGRIASVDSSEDLRVWDPASGAQVGQTVSGLGTNGATGAAFLSDGSTIVALTRGGDLWLVDAERGQSLTAAPIDAHDGQQAFGLSMNPSGTVFATVGGDGVVRMWDLLSTDAACDLVDARLTP